MADTPAVEITSFGYLHGAPPPGAHLTIDLRVHFRDPHINPALRHLTAVDKRVQDAVLDTPGITALVAAAADAVTAFRSGPGTGPVVVACGCAGGRHRAAVVAMTLAGFLLRNGLTVAVYHRDLHRPVVER